MQTFLFLSSLLMLITSCDRQSQHDLEVFNHILQKLNLSIPNQSHTFIIITKDGCTACKALSSAYARQNNSDTVTFITTPQLQQLYELGENPHVIIDSSASIDRLNWSLKGIIEVTTKEHKIVKVQCHGFESSQERFTPFLDISTINEHSLSCCNINAATATPPSETE